MMKKISVIVAIVLAITISFFSCSKSEKSNSATPNQDFTKPRVITLAYHNQKIINYAAQETVSKNDIPVLIDFYADWCGPCRNLEPIYIKLAKKYKGKILFAKVNVDSNPQFAEMYGVQSIPTMVFIPPKTDSSEFYLISGYQDEGQLKDLIQTHFGINP